MARDKTPSHTNSFGVADGFDFNPAEEDTTNVASPAMPSASPKASVAKKPSKPPVKAQTTDQGKNPYYQYHPKTGSRGKALGAPRKEAPRTQISIGCTVEDKSLYIQAAAADGRKLPDFVNTAVKEYIRNHKLV